jgi:hypothetical protein
MKRPLRCLLFALALVPLLLVGCSDKDRGKNREQKDRPKATPEKTAWLSGSPR